MKLSATLANGTWLAASLPAWGRFQHALRCPEQAQANILNRLVRQNAETAYGQAHQFEQIHGYTDFCERVPIVDYDALEPWITRICLGETNVLTSAPVTRLVPTSGSTAARKLIPFTAALQAEFNAAIGPWMVDLCRQQPGVALGPAYWSISPAVPPNDEPHSVVPIGFDDDSAYLGGLRQRLAAATFAVPPALRLVAEAETNRYLTLLCLLHQPELRLISVWHPSFLALMLGALPGWWAELLEDLARGGCRRAEALPPAIREALRPGHYFPPRAQHARRLREITPQDPQAIWPKLQVISAWGDGQAGLPLASLQARLPRVHFQSKGLLATEAFVTLPFRGRHPVAVCSHFYEFADAAGGVHRAHELQRGETYRVIVTTAGGLWRYRLGDEVEVDGFCDRTPALRFLGRGAAVSDLCGEKLSESFVTTALQAAVRRMATPPPFAMLAPECHGPTGLHYTLFIQGTLPDELLDALEAELAKNPNYAHARRLGQLGPLRGCPIADDAYATFCRVLAEGRRRLGEIKPQALSTRQDWRRHFQVGERVVAGGQT
jgi:hypothetical protein